MNNDRLKFRVWDKITKRYFYLELKFGDNGYHPDFIQDPVFEQCTGLRDKNGTLIYEGDIVRYGSNTSMGVVKYGEFNCSCCEGVYGWYFDNEEDIRNYEYYEVIGNIHEQKD